MSEKEEEKPVEDKQAEAAPDKKQERTYNDEQVNALLAKERKAYDAKLKAEQEAFAAYKKQIEDKQAEAEAAAKEKVEKLREGLPEGIVNLLDKLTATDQLEWLSDPANTLEHKTINPLPPANLEKGKLPSIGTIV